MRPSGSESGVRQAPSAGWGAARHRTPDSAAVGLADLDDVVALHSQPPVIEFLGSVSREDATERLKMCERAWREYGYDLLAMTDATEAGRACLMSAFDEFAFPCITAMIRPDKGCEGLAAAA